MMLYEKQSFTPAKSSESRSMSAYMAEGTNQFIVQQPKHDNLQITTTTQADNLSLLPIVLVVLLRTIIR